MYSDFLLREKTGADFESFHATFQRINTELWSLYDKGLIDRSVIRKNRFLSILESFGAGDQKLSEHLSDAYVSRSPQKGHLIEGAKELLLALNEKLPLFIVTNGFEEVQYQKVRCSGLEGFFREVVISEKIGHKKPSREIFDHIMGKHSLSHHESIMIGDNLLTDIAGAKNAGIDSVFFNPEKNPHDSSMTYEIGHLLELRSILG